MLPGSGTFLLSPWLSLYAPLVVREIMSKKRIGTRSGSRRKRKPGRWRRHTRPAYLANRLCVGGKGFAITILFSVISNLFPMSLFWWLVRIASIARCKYFKAIIDNRSSVRDRSSWPTSEVSMRLLCLGFGSGCNASSSCSGLQSSLVLPFCLPAESLHSQSNPHKTQCSSYIAEAGENRNAPKLLFPWLIDCIDQGTSDGNAYQSTKGYHREAGRVVPPKVSSIAQLTHTYW